MTTVATKAAPYGTNIGTAQSWEFFSTTVSPHSHYSGKEYERLPKSELTYLIKLNEGLEEIDIPDNTDAGIIKNKMIVLRKDNIEHKCRRIAYWDHSKGFSYQQFGSVSRRDGCVK